MWDLKYPGPETLDAGLAPPRNKPLAERADLPAGPTVVPGRPCGDVAGFETMAVEFSVVKDPRLSTTLEDYRQQFELVRELTALLGKVNATANRIRRLKHQLSVLAGGSEDDKHGLPAQAKAVVEKLTALEAILGDVHRESDRDVLRNPAGLNDTLLASISTVSVSDNAPTKQAAAVSKEIMARAEAEIGKLERLAATEVAAVNRLALEQEVEAASGG